MSSFCDQVTLTVKAGDGGPGMVSFRREKYVPHGGPDGGDGGRGGSVILRVNPNLNTLIDFQNGRLYEGDAGEKGHRFNMAGACAEDLVLDVPPGTQVFDLEKERLIVDLVELGTEYVLLKGGKGGFGNAHFKSSVRQAPDFAELGEPGKALKVRLEMKMVADVGIIGLPSVGKSTLISRISNVKPKIADYPFTTLVPNMGVVNLSKWGGGVGESFVVADIPGLIEGAHEGKGLGHEFLRHISRTAMLVHMLDCQSHDITEDFRVIYNELKQYDPELAQRPQIVVVNKTDTIDEATQDLLRQQLESFFKKNKFKFSLYFISGVSGEGLKPLMHALWASVQTFRADQLVRAKDSGESTEDFRVFRPHLDGDAYHFSVEVEPFEDDLGMTHQKFRVHGERIEQIASMTDFSNPSAIRRLHDVMRKMGIHREVVKRGATLGDLIEVWGQTIEFRE